MSLEAFRALRSRAGRSGMSAFQASRQRRGRRRNLRQEVAQLEQLQQLTGAPELEQDQPSFLARTIDVLSGLNYAAAGAFEELSQGNGLGSAVRRAATELYSSARSLPFMQLLPELGEPQKEAFAEVFEQLGMKTTTLADVFPALDGTFLGEFINTRGTVGLVADIVSDPLTWMTFGTSALARRTLGRFAQEGVKKGVNKKGLAKLTEFERAIRRERGLLEAGAREAAEETAEIASEATRRVIELGDDTLFDPGGAKLAGVVIPGTPGLGSAALSKISKPFVNTMNRFGYGRRIVKGAENYWDGTKAIMREIFGAFGALEQLPEGMRDSAISVARKWIGAPAQMAAKLHLRIEGSHFVKYFRTLDESGRKEWIDAVDRGVEKFADPAAAAAAADFRTFANEIAERGIAEGLFDENVIRNNPTWIFHRYLNEMDEIPEAWVGWRGTMPSVSGKHNKKQHFDTMVDSEEVTGLLEKVSTYARSKGFGTPLYKKLRPDYDLEKGLIKYVSWFSNEAAMRGLRRDMGKMFGVDETKFAEVAKAMMSATDDILDASHPEFLKVEEFFVRGGIEAGEVVPRRRRSMNKILDEEMELFAREGVRQEDARIEAWGQIAEQGKRLLRELSPDGQRQFFKELFLSLRSPSQFVDAVRSFGDDYLERFPAGAREVLEGTFEDRLYRFGEKAQYTVVGGNEMFGEGAYMVPRLIAEYVENANSRILNTKDFQGWRFAVQKWARINNLFKTSVYPFFPSSAFRDKYSNLFLTGMRIGWHAIDPSLRGHSIAVLSKGKSRKLVQDAIGTGFTSKTGRRYSHDEVLALMEENNVLVSGLQFGEVTDDGIHRISTVKPIGQVIKSGDVREIARNLPSPATAKGRARVLEFRARIDNDDRAALFIQDLIDGLTPEEAAADVAEFLYNYNELGAIHRDFVRNVIPFATFTVKNIRNQVRMLRTNPGAVINQLKPFRGRQSENDQMAKFEAEGLKLRLDGDGKTIRAVTGIDLPLRNLDVLWAGGFGATGRRFLGMMSPVIKAPVELATRRDLFIGAPLERANAPTFGRIIEATESPKWLKDWLGYKKEPDAAGRPKYTVDGVRYQLLIRSFIFSRIMSTSDRQFREYLGDRNIAASMIDVLTGLRRQDLNLSEQMERRMYQRRRQLIDVLTRRGVLDPFAVPGRPDLTGLQ